MFIEQVSSPKVSGVVHVCEQHAIYDLRKNISGWGWVFDTCSICGRSINGKFFDIGGEYIEREERHARIAEEFSFEDYINPQDSSVIRYEYFSEPEPSKLWQRIKGWFK